MMLDVSGFDVWSANSLSDGERIVYIVPLEIKANLRPQMRLKAPWSAA